ncbi:GIY-YIG nuclease family protein [Candidatus Woesebacteria bacterium]|nr:GIY-YIG nuclease family protein [Candidatus Woesebacteria bacterium]
MKNHYVYAIKSLRDKRIYVGISQNPRKRLVGHNAGQTRSTKPFRPWVLIYSKMIGSRKEEKRMKSGYVKEWLRTLTNCYPR